MRPDSAFPLQWPDGTPRTKVRHRSDFRTGFTKARDRLYEELRKMGGGKVMISSNMPLRANGQPYAAGGRGIMDPGVAVYWMDSETRAERVMACDRWLDAGDNMHALALSIAALRGIERWGGSAIVDRAFAGFAALPPGPPPPEPIELPIANVWREILRLHTDDDLDLDVARSRYRKLARELHPDTGATDDRAMKRLNAAWEFAQKELG